MAGRNGLEVVPQRNYAEIIGGDLASVLDVWFNPENAGPQKPRNNMTTRIIREMAYIADQHGLGKLRSETPLLSSARQLINRTCEASLSTDSAVSSAASEAVNGNPNAATAALDEMPLEGSLHYAILGVAHLVFAKSTEVFPTDATHQVRDTGKGVVEEGKEKMDAVTIKTANDHLRAGLQYLIRGLVQKKEEDYQADPHAHWKEGMSGA